VKHAFIHDHRGELDVSVMCAVFGVAPAGYYAGLVRPESDRATRARELTEQIRLVHAESRGVYGCIKITNELRHRHRKLNTKTVARLMAAAGIRSKVAKKFRVQTTDSRHDNPIAPNTLDRKFTVEAPNTVWVSDITYIHTGEGFAYLAGVMDLFSRKIVGWSIDHTMTTDLVEKALDAAIRTRRPAVVAGAGGSGDASAGLLHHSDRGVQYTSERYRRQLLDNGIQASMSRTGNCYDNAVMESFWGKLKSEMVFHERFATLAQARAAVFDYIEAFYNRVRIHATLGYVSPEQFEAGRA
jgi:putative transposase